MKNFTKKLTLIALTVLPAISLAQNPFDTGVPDVGVRSLTQVQNIIIRLVNWVTGLFFAVAILFLFWAAYLYLSAAGDQERLTKAKDQLIYSIVAIAIALLAGSIRFVVENILRGGL